MELDDLKTSWQNETAIYSELNKKDMEQLQAILKEKTSGTIAVIKNKFEKIITMMLVSMLLIVCVFPLISEGLTDPGSAMGFFKLVFFYLVLLSFYWLKLRSYNRLRLSEHIPLSLSYLLKKLKRGRRHELTVAILFFPLVSITGRLFYGKGFSDLNAPGVVPGLILGLVFTLIMVWLIKRRYDKHIREIEGYLKEYTDR